MKISKKSAMILKDLIENAKNYSFDKDQGELDTSVEKLIKHLHTMEKRIKKLTIGYSESLYRTNLIFKKR